MGGAKDKTSRPLSPPGASATLVGSDVCPSAAAPGRAPGAPHRPGHARSPSTEPHLRPQRLQYLGMFTKSTTEKKKTQILSETWNQNKSLQSSVLLWGVGYSPALPRQHSTHLQAPALKSGPAAASSSSSSPRGTLGMAQSHFCEQAPCPACRPPRDSSVIPVVNLKALATKSTAVAKLGAHRPAVHVSHIWYVVHCTVHEGGLTMP